MQEYRFGTKNFPHGFCPNCGTSVYARSIEGEYVGIVAINVSSGDVKFQVFHVLMENKRGAPWRVSISARWRLSNWMGKKSRSEWHPADDLGKIHVLDSWTFNTWEHVQGLTFGSAFVKNYWTFLFDSSIALIIYNKYIYEGFDLHLTCRFPGRIATVNKRAEGSNTWENGTIQ